MSGERPFAFHFSSKSPAARLGDSPSPITWFQGYTLGEIRQAASFRSRYKAMGLPRYGPRKMWTFPTYSRRWAISARSKDAHDAIFGRCQARWQGRDEPHAPAGQTPAPMRHRWSACGPANNSRWNGAMPGSAQDEREGDKREGNRCETGLAYAAVPLRSQFDEVRKAILLTGNPQEFDPDFSGLAGSYGSGHFDGRLAFGQVEL